MQSMVQSDEICSDYFGPIVSIQLSGQISQWQWENTPDHPTESDMSDYHRSPPINISPNAPRTQSWATSLAKFHSWLLA